MQDSQGSNPRFVAYHEAGHAVACHVQGMRLKSVSITPGDSYLGSVRTSYDLTTYANPHPELEADIRSKVEREIIVAYAGQIAEARVRGEYNKPGAVHDDQVALEQALPLVHGDQNEVGALLRRLFGRSKSLIEEPRNWTAVETLAEELLKESTLGGSHAHAIIRGTLKWYDRLR